MDKQTYEIFMNCKEQGYLDTNSLLNAYSLITLSNLNKSNKGELKND